MSNSHDGGNMRTQAMQRMGREERQHRRAYIPRVSVRYELAPSEFVVGDVLEMSLGGMFIQASRPLPVGRLLDAEIRVLGQPLPISAIGRVMWTRGANEGESRPTGMGVKLIDIESTSREVIGRLVAVRQQTMHGLGPAELGTSSFQRQPVAPSLRAAPAAGGVSGAGSVRAPEANIPIYLVTRKVARAPARSGGAVRLLSMGALLGFAVIGPGDGAAAGAMFPATSGALVAGARARSRENSSLTLESGERPRPSPAVPRLPMAKGTSTTPPTVPPETSKPVPTSARSIIALSVKRALARLSTSLMSK